MKRILAIILMLISIFAIGMLCIFVDSKAPESDDIDFSIDSKTIEFSEGVDSVHNSEELIPFYTDLLTYIMEYDPGLNGGIEIIAFDFSKLENLNDNEKTELMQIIGQKYGKEVISGTFEELRDKGYIDEDILYFPNGVLLSIETSDCSKKSFAFSISKWRSGLGAIGIDNCKAKFSKNSWSYTEGISWIS